MRERNKIIDLYQQAYYALYRDVVMAIELLKQGNSSTVAYVLEDTLRNTENVISKSVLKKKNGQLLRWPQNREHNEIV